jgi:hypothetical protein
VFSIPFYFLINHYLSKKIYIFLEKQNHSPDGLTKKAEKKKMPIPHDGNRLFR